MKDNKPMNRKEFKRNVKNVSIKLIDYIGGLTFLIPLVLFMTFRAIIGKKGSTVPNIKKILVFDMSYPFEMVEKRHLYQPILARDLNGYFDHVFSVHLCATIIPPENKEGTYGKISITAFAPRHTIIEGKIGRFQELKNFPILNFILAQWHIYIYLYLLIRREKICVLRAGDPYYQGLIGLALSRATGIPSVFRIPINYDLFYKLTGDLAFPRLFRKRRIEKFIDHFTLKRADLVAGGNEDGLGYVLKNGVKKEHTTIFRIGNLIHPSHFESSENRPDSKNILKNIGLTNKNFSITISRIEPLKQIDDVLQVCAEVKRQGYNLSSLIVGDGTMKESLMAIAEEMGLKDDVIFTGNKDQEWIATVLPSAKVVISPFMGRGLTEAAMSGVPIVAYDIEWQSELIKTGETGELVPYRDWKGMVASVIKYLEDPQYASKMGENARKATLDMMDPVKLNQYERDAYDGLFARYYSKEKLLFHKVR